VVVVVVLVDHEEVASETEKIEVIDPLEAATLTISSEEDESDHIAA